MTKNRSFARFIDDLLIAQGFTAKRRFYWYKFEKGHLIVVNLQKSSFGGGVYVNYGLTFLTGSKRFPKEYDCVVFGRNPALSPTEFSRFQGLLDDIGALRKDPTALAEVASLIHTQLAALATWSDRKVLVKRVLSRKPLEMIVDKHALGLPL